MKINLLLFLLSIALTGINLIAQPPALIPYQAIARDAASNAVLNQNIGLRFSIHDQTITGTVVWQEAQTVLSNPLGVVVTSLGSVSDLSTVNWAQGDKFLQVEMDIAGGTNYSDMGTQQMMSVPYALYAGTSGQLTSTGASSVNVGSTSLLGDTLYTQNGGYVIIPGISAANNGGLAASCGAPNVLNHNINYGTLADIDGNTYKTVVIGNQEWMAENLRVSRYSDGTPISYVANEYINQGNTNSWSILNNGAYTWYNNDSANFECPYGKLYNGYAAISPNNVCPTGWHVPTGNDWLSLQTHLGGPDISGARMKSVGYNYWNVFPGQNTFPYFSYEGTSNSSGFSALPAGLGYGFFLAEGESAHYWSSSIGSTGNSLVNFNLQYGEQYSYIQPGDGINTGKSLRCIKDN
jgi:uncharacterized protein (TIGR02145 family)